MKNIFKCCLLKILPRVLSVTILIVRINVVSAMFCIKTIKHQSIFISIFCFSIGGVSAGRNHCVLSRAILNKHLLVVPYKIIYSKENLQSSNHIFKYGPFFNQKVLIIFIFFHKSICCGYLLALSLQVNALKAKRPSNANFPLVPDSYVPTVGGVPETELYHKHRLNIVQPSVKSRSRSKTADGSGQGAWWLRCA